MYIFHASFGGMDQRRTNKCTGGVRGNARVRHVGKNDYRQDACVAVDGTICLTSRLGKGFTN